MAEEHRNNTDPPKTNWGDAFKDPDFIAHLNRFLFKREQWTAQDVFIKLVLLVAYSFIIIRITMSLVNR